MAAGGQGAPLAPAFHQAVFYHAQEHRIVLNIGGIANITVLPTDNTVIGFDTGPGNALLDAFIQQQQGVKMDVQGAWAQRGQVQVELLKRLLGDPYFSLPAPKSTGRDYFNLDWLQSHLTEQSFRPEAIQATLCQLTIDTIVQAVEPYHPQRLLVCGGGVHNPVLMNGLTQKLPYCQVESTLAHGIDPDWVEAMCFAWLAKQRLEGQPGNLPTVTGARQAVVLGGIYL
jgi:anhydro-N-acetylmuramic acid kinase